MPRPSPRSPTRPSACRSSPAPPPARPDAIDSTLPEAYRQGSDALLQWAADLHAACDDDPTAELRAALWTLDLAADVAAGTIGAGAGVLQGNPGASAETRGALQSAMDAVLDDLDAARSPLQSVRAYAAAVADVQASQAAADAAAAAAANSGVGGSGGWDPMEMARFVCDSRVPIVHNGMTFPVPDECWFDFGDGPVLIT